MSGAENYFVPSDWPLVLRPNSIFNLVNTLDPSVIPGFTPDCGNFSEKTVAIKSKCQIKWWTKSKCLTTSANTLTLDNVNLQKHGKDVGSNIPQRYIN